MGWAPAIPLAHGPAYLAELQELPVVVDKGQDLLKVKVLLLALHPQVVEGQVNHIHPGRGGRRWGQGEAAASAQASWVRTEGQGQG